MADGLKRELELAGNIASREFLKEVYGPASPWGERATEKSLLHLKKGGIVRYYDRFISPDRMILAMAGDFKTADLLKELEAVTAKYPPKGLTELHTPGVEEERPPETKRIKKDFAQSAIYAGHLGSTRDDPNKFALVIMNHILGGGGGFTSRLQDAIRVKGGLAYEVWSSFSFGPKGAKGLFAVHVKTRNKTVDKAIEMIGQEVERLRDGGVTPDEFRQAREGILNGIIFDYERAFNIVSAVARFVYLGLPEDYIEVYKKGIESVKIEDVNRAAKEYLHPEMFKTAIAGGK
jgi:zinc protease